MPKIVRFPLLGGKRGRSIALLIAALLAAGPVVADDYADGIAAFASGDYRGATTYLQKAADNGSAQAFMQLGLISDLGLVVNRDPAKAFGYYLAAAQMGLPDAAFNVGVMLDAGTDVRRDLVAAGVWYARSALAGNKRAALNLGLLYQDGSGVLVNDDLAAYWFGKAADALPAAKAALKRLKGSQSGTIVPPVPLAAEVLQKSENLLADLVWTAKPGTEGSMFAVQVFSAGRPGSQDATVWTQETFASALQISVGEGGLIWRVARIDPVLGQYQASPWQHQLGAEGAIDPIGLVSFVVNAGDQRAEAVARNLARGLQNSGLAVAVSTAVQPIATSAILYRYLDDAEVADQLAGLLPGFAPGTVRQLADLPTGPGEIVVNLVMQPTLTFSP